MDNETMKSVLVVDDTPTNIDILVGILSDDYLVSVATDGPSALESVVECLPDIILLDIMMPGMDGYEVCRRLKADESSKDIPVIFITAMNDIQDELRAFEAGGVDYITKPFSPPVVLRRVQSVLALEDKTRQLSTLAKKLSKYLSPQVYVSIFRGDQDVEITSKRKKLTIFFSDIVNFTSTTEGMETEDLTDLLNSYLEEMSSIALKYGGTIDKFIGDAILIFFGDPLSMGIEEDACACVSMAIEMREQLKKLQEKWYSFGMQNPFKVRVGITTGYCTVGNFGSRNRMDYTIIGSQVNIASRLESNAQPGQILISHETWSLINKKIHCLKDKKIKVKGISHPIQTYQVTDLIENIEVSNTEITAGQLSENILSIDCNAKITEAYLLLADSTAYESAVIMNDNEPIGLFSRCKLIESHNNIPTDVFMEQTVLDHMQPILLSVDKDWPAGDIAERFIERADNSINDPVIVTSEGKLIGQISAVKLLKYFLGDRLL